MMADISRSPVAGCRLAPTSGRCAPPTERGQPHLNLNRQISTGLEREHDATASRIWFGTWPAGAAARERGKCGRVAGAQGRSVGNEGAAYRLVGPRHDDAALYRRDHRQGNEHLVLADGQGDVLQAGHPE